jgi:hypothetical protein
MNFAASNLQADVVESDNARKGLGDVLHLKDAVRPLRSSGG